MVFPRLLTTGDKIALVAPAGKTPSEGLNEAIEVLSSWGLQVVLGQHVYASNNYFAGKDEDRLADLQKAFDDPAIAAILCARGGYGITRILAKINLKPTKKKPKWVIGFSDITALLLKLENNGIAGIHGPMGTSFSKGSNASINSLKALLFKGESKIIATEAGMKPGSVTAAITGGNLSLIVDSLGTPDEIDTSGKILFIEETGEKSYRVDRMFHQLQRAGKLDKLAGLVIGQFSNIEDGNPFFGESWREVIINITRPFSYPIGFGFSIGHEPENMAIVLGGQYQLIVSSNQATLTWQFPG